MRVGAVIVLLLSPNVLCLGLSALWALGSEVSQGSSEPLMQPLSPPDAPVAQCSEGVDVSASGSC